MTGSDPSVWDAPAVRAPRPCKPYGAAGVLARRTFVSPGRETMEFDSKAFEAPAAFFDELAPVTLVTPPRESTHCPLAHPRQE